MFCWDEWFWQGLLYKKQLDSEEGGHLTSSSFASFSSTQFDLTVDSIFLDDSLITNTFKLISSNFRGLHFKKASFLQLIESESPHLISGTESWLNSTVLSSEIFPSEYQVFHSDRNDGYGGAFFVCHSSINCSQIPLPKTQLRQLLVKYSQMMIKLW